MKTCPRCKIEFPYEEFGYRKSSRGSTILKPYCKECQRAYRREHYHENPAPYKERAIKTKKIMLQWYKDIKDNKPCTDCGISYPYYVMDWDHLDNKTFGLSKKLKGQKGMLEEIQKCELVCANCHRIRTHNRIALV